jgi:two-component system cell cycle response regulator
MTYSILIVDDDWMNREVLQAHLESVGYRVLTANSGPVALELAAANEVDLVLLDVRMPGMDGYEVCIHLRNNERTAAVPVLLITALEDEATKTRGLEVGVDDFITKPLDALIMLNRIRGLLRMRQFQQELVRRERVLWDVLVQYVPPDVAQQIMVHLAE